MYRKCIKTKTVFSLEVSSSYPYEINRQTIELSIINFVDVYIIHLGVNLKVETETIQSVS